uniref:Peroxisomal membrane protein PEX14-like KPWE domain-containing protein n=1 Tax=Salmo trutta TaxID=8032 RepID=A0A673XR85_SALTR
LGWVQTMVCHTTGGTSANTDAALSFKEVFRLVQAGEEVPGLSKLDIKPNNQTPTPSQMERRPKPWENSKTHISSLTPFISEDSVFSEGDISTLELLVVEEQPCSVSGTSA